MPENRNSKVQQGPAMPVADRGFVPAANQDHVTVTDLSSLVTLNIPKNVSYIMIQARTQNVRYTIDGSRATSLPPSTSRGFELIAGDPPTVLPVVAGRTTLRFIQQAGNAVLEYQYGE